MNEWPKLSAFLTRDWSIHSSYRLSLLVGVGQFFLMTASFFFISQLVDPHRVSALAPYGGAYFPFVLLGLALSRYATTGMSSFSQKLREEQLQGTLEAMLTTPVALSTLLIGNVLWEFLWASLEAMLYLSVGTWVFGLNLARMDVPASLVLLGLAVLACSGIGVVLASGTLLLKESDPVGWVLDGLMRLVSGVYFPIALLPGAIQSLAKLFPLTYALEGLRQAVLVGRSVGELWKIGAILAVFAAILWPLGLIGMSWTIRRLKITGTLSFR